MANKHMKILNITSHKEMQIKTTNLQAKLKTPEGKHRGKAP